MRGKVEIARLLIEKQAALEHPDVVGETVVHALASFIEQKGSFDELEMSVEDRQANTAPTAIEMFEMLTSNGFDEFDGPVTCQNTGHIPFFTIAASGNYDVSSKLLSIKRKCQNTLESSATYVENNELFHAAAEGGSLKLMMELREAYPHASIDTLNGGQQTPLVQAIVGLNYGHDSLLVINWLLDEGACPNPKSRFSSIPLCKLIWVRGGHNENPKRDLEIFNRLVAEGADVNEPDDVKPILHAAAERCDLQTLQALIKQPELDIHVMDCNGWNALHLIAVQTSYEDDRAMKSSREIRCLQDATMQQIQKTKDVADCIDLLLASGIDAFTLSEERSRKLAKGVEIRSLKQE